MNTILENMRDFEISLESVLDDKLLNEVRNRLSDLLDRLDDKLDLHLSDQRRDEPTMSHAQLTRDLASTGHI